MTTTGRIMSTMAQFPKVALAAGVFALVGCGGSGDGGGGPAAAPATVSAAEGLWVGSTEDDRAVTGLVFDNGLYYILYSVSGDASTIAGVVQGNSATSGANFSSSNARDFNLEGEGVLAATVAANFAAKSTLAGTVTYGPGLTNTFSTSYDSDYELTPTRAAVAGTYTGEVAFSLGVEAATIVISGTGALSGTGASGCAVTGAVNPRLRGNAYNVTITFGGAPCSFANQSFTGIGYYDATAQRFYSATPNGARTDGILFVGVKPLPV